MDRTLIIGNPVVTLGEAGIIDDGALIVVGREIEAVGSRVDLEQRGPFDKVLGSDSHFVMPGFANCHYHSELAVGPGLFEFIFERANVMLVHPAGGAAEEDVHTIVLWGLIQAIKGGQTSAIDFFYGRPGLEHFSAPAALQAYRDAGFRSAFGLVSRDENIYAHEADADFLARLPADLAAEVRASNMGYAWPVDEVMTSFRALADEWHGKDDLIHLIVAPDWTPSCSDDLYRRCVQVADEYDTCITTHALETRAEMMYNLERYGMSALARLDELGVLGPRTSLAHFVWVTDDDVGRFADSGAVASNNPGSNLRLSTGICRVRDLLDAGGNVGFGTDGISFSERDDFFQELRLAAYLQRTPAVFEVGRMDSLQLLTSASHSGAQAMGWGGRLGSLTPGALADLLVVRRDRIFFPPHRFDQTPFLDVVVDRTESTDIDSVMINGQTVLEDGVVTVVDENVLRQRVVEATERLYPLGATTQQSGISARIDPYIVDFYQRWYDTPVEPAYLYNPQRAPTREEG
ncbi:MAG: amidohydrolase family protein [Acidimicrobiia bacterium]|nr:amidohydrolase family protein [Acidimicrobiia bacterium]